MFHVAFISCVFTLSYLTATASLYFCVIRAKVGDDVLGRIEWVFFPFKLIGRSYLLWSKQNIVSIVPMTASSNCSQRFNSRLFDARLEHLNTLIPLQGYAVKPLLPLADAVKELNGKVDGLDSRVWTALERSKDPADGLTPDESAAIVLYTIEWDLNNPSLYYVLNNKLRLEDRNGLVCWFSYLKLLLTALFKLPSVPRTVWRGVREDLSSSYKLGDTVTWWGFNSCTASLSTLMNSQYIGDTGTCTLFVIQCLNGKAIKRHSYYAYEDEILLLPCTRLEVLDCIRRQDGLHIIHLLEVQPPHVLLEPPFPLDKRKAILLITQCGLLRAYFLLDLIGPNLDQQDAGRCQGDRLTLTEENARLKAENQVLQQRYNEIRKTNTSVNDLHQENERLRMALDRMQNEASKSIGQSLGNWEIPFLRML